MSDQNKIQIPLEVTSDTTGLQDVGAAAQVMAQEVQQAGEQAATGLDKVSAGAKRAADGVSRDSSRIASELRRVTLEMQSLGKSASEKIELKIASKGLNTTDFAPALAELKELERARAAIAAQQPRDNFIGGLRGQLAELRETLKLQQMTTEEALRYKAAQLGASAEASQLITQLTNMRAAQEAATIAAQRQAQAQKEAAVATRTKDSFLADLKGQADAIGKTRAELLELKAAELGVAKEAEGYIAKLKKVEAGQNATGISAKQTAFALRQMPAQFTDIIVSLQAGQNPLQVLLQQGGQIKDLFGGVGNAFRGIASLITPMTVGIGAAIVALGALGYAMSKVETESRGLNTLQAQLGATGRGSLFSTDELRSFVRELARAPGVTRESATAVVSELSKVHQIGAPLFRDLANLAVDYAKATGTDVPTAMRTLAKAFVDPAKGARELDEALGKLSSGQILDIDKLVKKGDIAGAQRILRDALQGLKGTAENALTPLQKSINDLGNTWDGAQDKLNESKGLRSMNELLAKTVGFVTFLVNNADKANEKLANLGGFAALIPGAGIPLLLAQKGNEGPVFQGKGATGSFEAPTTAPSAASAGKSGSAVSAPAASQAAPLSDKEKDEFIKRAIEAGKAHRSEATQLADLKIERDRQNESLRYSIQLFGKDSEQAKKARDALAGLNEEITKVGLSERQQTIDARLDQKLKAAKEALEAERATIAFQQRYLQGAYQESEISLRDFYEQKRQAISAGVQAQIVELAKERAAVAEHLKATKAANPKDTSAIIKDQTRLKEIDSEESKLRLAASREVVLANQEETASTRQLREEVTNYRASLLQMVGDEQGAAKLRDQLAIEQTKRLADRAKEQGFAIDPKEVQRNAQLLQQTRLLNEARRESTFVNDALAVEEERIALAQRNGQVTSIEALNQTGEARRRVVAQLEEIVKAQEEVARTRPKDYQLQIDTARARVELEKLKSELDPLAETFRGIFASAGGNALNDLASGKFGQIDQGKLDKRLSDIKVDFDRKEERIKDDGSLTLGERSKQLRALDKDRDAAEAKARSDASVSAFSQIKAAGVQMFKELGTEVSQMVNKSLVEQLFSKEGLLGNLPGNLADGFRKGGPLAQKPLVDTSGVTSSLNNFQNAGLQPATNALGQFTEGLQTAAGAVAKGSPTSGDFARLDRGQTPQAAEQPTTGDFARADRASGIPSQPADVRSTPTPVVDTSAITRSLAVMQTSGVDPATQALGEFAQVVRTASAAAQPGAPSSFEAPAGVPVPAREVVTTGDFTRLDRAPASAAAAQQQGEVRVASLDTSVAIQSLTELQTDGLQPATSGLVEFTQALQTARGYAQQSGGQPLPSGSGVVHQAAGSTPTTGDFARLDRASDGEAGAAVGKDVSNAASSFVESTKDAIAANGGASLALSALALAAGKGHAALALLPQIIQVIQAAAAAMSASSGSGGSGVGGLLGSLFSGSSAGAVSNTAFGSTTFAEAFASGLIPMDSGGYTGDADPKKVTGWHHGQEFVMSAPAVKAIGLDRLEALHVAAKRGDVAGMERALQGGDHSSKTTTTVNQNLFAAPAAANDVVMQVATGDRKEPRARTPEGGMVVHLHSGRVVGETRDATPVSAQVMDNAPRHHASGVVVSINSAPSLAGVERVTNQIAHYHAGGTVKLDENMRAAGGLKPNEVPAILMGGPKGTREEVLKADDPRHTDNLSPQLRHLIKRMPRYHDGGVVMAAPNYAPSTSMTSTAAAPQPAQKSANDNGWQERPINLTVNMTAAPGMGRATTLQQGAVIGEGIQRALRRGN